MSTLRTCCEENHGHFVFDIADVLGIVHGDIEENVKAASTMIEPEMLTQAEEDIKWMIEVLTEGQTNKGYENLTKAITMIGLPVDEQLARLQLFQDKVLVPARAARTAATAAA